MSRLSWMASMVLLAATIGHSSRPASAIQASTGDTPEFGALVMAHGGSPEWNAAILATIEPLRDRYPIEVAFGMADAATMQKAIHRLEAGGVRRIAVVRLFVSGESWYERTEQILGLSPGAATQPAPPEGQVSEGGHGRHDPNIGFWRVQTESSFALSTQGLAEAETMGFVLADRARTLSREPRREDVLILAHGPGDDSENERWMAWLNARAETVRDTLPFRRVEVLTLREDWPEKRPEAEERIRSFAESARDDGITTLVLPFRVFGFGAYAEVLKDLDYIADGQGLVPHEAVTAWIAANAEALRPGTFRSPGSPKAPADEAMKRLAGDHTH